MTNNDINDEQIIEAMASAYEREWNREQPDGPARTFKQSCLDSMTAALAVYREVVSGPALPEGWRLVEVVADEESGDYLALLRDQLGRGCRAYGGTRQEAIAKAVAIAEVSS